MPGGALRRNVRLQDVATAAGVSLATASRSLSGSGGVSVEVAARVRSVAAELGYVANAHARSLAGAESRTVGLVVHDVSDPFSAEVAGGVLSAGTREGLSVHLCHTGRDPQEELRQVRTLIAHGVRAIVLGCSGFEGPALRQASQHNLAPFMGRGGRVAVIGRHFDGVDAVLPDYRGGARAVTAHVLAQGHRRIAIACGPRMLTSVVDLLAGAADACRASGLDFDRVPVLEEEVHRAGGVRIAERVLDSFPDVTAVVALNDILAIGVVSHFRTRGLSVPRDVSVTGLGDLPIAQDIAPALTTATIDIAGLGSRALALTLEKRPRKPRSEVVGYQLVVRDSTAAPRVAPATTRA